MNKLTKFLHITLSSTFIIFCFFSFANNGNNNKEQAINIEYDKNDIVAVWGCDYYNGEKGIKIKILSVTGGSGNYNITENGNGFVNPTSISEGEGFEYFFTKSDQQNGVVEFTVTDAQNNNNTAKMDDELIIQFEGFTDIGINCKAPIKCTEAVIAHDEFTTISTDVYQATDKIISSGTIPERNTSYIAANEICLNEGFEVKLVSNFIAKIIKPCTIQ